MTLTEPTGISVILTDFGSAGASGQAGGVILPATQTIQLVAESLHSKHF
jgi:hypothetical protein